MNCPPPPKKKVPMESFHSSFTHITRKYILPNIRLKALGIYLSYHHLHCISEIQTFKPTGPQTQIFLLFRCGQWWAGVSSPRGSITTPLGLSQDLHGICNQTPIWPPRTTQGVICNHSTWICIISQRHPLTCDQN